MLSKVCLQGFPKINFNGGYNKIACSTLERSPGVDSVEFSSKKSAAGLTPELKKVLDNKILKFEKQNGEIFEGTIKEYFENSIINRREAGGMSFVHCTPSKDTAEKIIDEGLDWRKTTRIRCGPGTYFSPSAAGGYEQGGGGNAINADYIGKKATYPIFEPRFYEAVQDNTGLKEILPSENSSKILNEYCHDVLQNQMGIDFLYAGSGRGVGAYVVVNDECVKLSKGF